MVFKFEMVEMVENPILIGIIDGSPESRSAFEDYFLKSKYFKLATSVPTYEKFVWNNRRKEKLGVLFVEIDLAYRTGLDSLPALRKLLPQTKLVIYTNSLDEYHIQQAFRRGADGYVLKNTPLEKLEIDALYAVKNGGVLLSSLPAEILVAHLLPKDMELGDIKLNSKERAVIQLIDEGKSYEQIGIASGMKIDAVRYYIKRVYRKLNVTSKTQMLRKVRSNGLIANLGTMKE